MSAGTIFLLFSCIGSAECQSEAQLAPADLVKAVIRNELKTSDISEVRWKYLLVKEVDGKQETREVIETKSGPLAA
jgi:hypothetical protein